MTIGRIPSVEGGIQPTIVDAKGDLIAATAADTVNRLAVGSNDQILVADSSTSTGLAWKSNATPFAAGKNKLINGDFYINQRAFTSTTIDTAFGFDRWKLFYTGGTCTYSAQTFTAGTAPVAGYEGTNFARLVTVSQSTSAHYAFLAQPIEDVRTFANQTITVSFWAKASTGTPKVAIVATQNFGSGGSAQVSTAVGQVTLSTSWVRYSASILVPSISGKTIGTSSHLRLDLWTSAGSDFTQAGGIGIQNVTIDFWGVQAEAGSVATAFQTATGTLQGELAACQRYYYRLKADAASRGLSAGMAYSTGFAWMHFNFPVEMRTRPTALEQSGTAGDYQMWKADSTKQVCTAVPVYDGMTTTRLAFFYTTTGSGLVAGNATYVESVNSNAFLGWSAEL